VTMLRLPEWAATLDDVAEAMVGEGHGDMARRLFARAAVVWSALGRETLAAQARTRSNGPDPLG
ncbi:MAG: hypothetical protein KC620_15565, partial [Myxococcales bacterium]|nr:hypothetical protein [Myxococcales bacterium]